MERYTNKQLKNLIETGAATDISYANSRDAISGRYTQIGYAKGVYGCSGMLFKQDYTNQLYVINGRTQAIYLF